MEWIFIIGFLWIVSSYLYNTSNFEEDGTKHLDYLKQELKDLQYEARTGHKPYKEPLKSKLKVVYSDGIDNITDLFIYKKLMYISAKDKAEYLRSEEWSDLKLLRLKIAQNKCECCGLTNSLQLHHITYERLTKERIEDLAILCSFCHTKIHSILGYDRTTKYPILTIKD